jgi:hypothetical protein
MKVIRSMRTVRKAKIRKSKITFPLLYMQTSLTPSRVPENFPNIFNVRFNNK